MGKFRGSEKDYYYLDSSKRRWERKRHFSPCTEGCCSRSHLSKELQGNAAIGSAQYPNYAHSLGTAEGFGFLSPTPPGEGGCGQGQGNQGVHASSPPAAAMCHMCCQMCLLKLQAPLHGTINPGTSCLPQYPNSCCPAPGQPFNQRPLQNTLNTQQISLLSLLATSPPAQCGFFPLQFMSQSLFLLCNATCSSRAVHCSALAWHRAAPCPQQCSSISQPQERQRNSLPTPVEAKG